MNRDANTAFVEVIMRDFAAATGLEPAGAHPIRYLWTDAFAVCNYLALFNRTNETKWRDLALLLVDQVHQTLGRHREDDPRKGWISGIPEQEGRLHPTRGGLRIGKPLQERGLTEPPDERREWDRDGQYFHYLTKWMHALNCVSRVTGDPGYTGWAIELADAAHAGFTYTSQANGRKQMYWKMSIDLSRPLVTAMGQHDPLDGLVTFSELEMAATRDFRYSQQNGLRPGINDMAEICRDMSLPTDDPLGTGGLLADATRIAGLIITGKYRYEPLLEQVMDAALRGTIAFSESDDLRLPAGYRLAFRELGLSIGLKGMQQLEEVIRINPEIFDQKSRLHAITEDLMMYVPLGETIEQFWMDHRNREAGTWQEHLDINRVMLATSLAPEGFLGI